MQNIINYYIAQLQTFAIISEKIEICMFFAVGEIEKRDNPQFIKCNLVKYEILPKFSQQHIRKTF